MSSPERYIIIWCGRLILQLFLILEFLYKRTLQEILPSHHVSGLQSCKHIYKLILQAVSPNSESLYSNT